MLLRAKNPYRRRPRLYRPSRLRFLPLFFVLILLWDVLTSWGVPEVHRASISDPPLFDKSSYTAGGSITRQPQRIFIASLQWNTEPFLLAHFNTALLSLVHHFGPSNVYISILENGSWDNTRAALSHLDIELERLGVERSIVYEDWTHEDELARVPAPGEEGWVWTGRGKKERRRISYMAGLRNKVMGVMEVLEGRGKGDFDRVLWLGDVLFTTEDVETLLQTNNNSYAAACSLDFSGSHPSLHSILPLRDLNFDAPISLEWPYFSSYHSRHALYNNLPIPVQSCWSGIVFLDAAPFYPSSSNSGSKTKTKTKNGWQGARRKERAGENLKFRGISDGLAGEGLEASECCLIHVDNPLSREKGVFVNPNVRVAYTQEIYDEVNSAGGRAAWPYSEGKGSTKQKLQKIAAIWRNRKERIMGWGDRYMEKWDIGRKVRLWDEREGKRDGGEGGAEPGVGCLVQEMQVLIDKGWANV